MGGNAGKTDTTQSTVMLPQNQATEVLALPRLGVFMCYTVAYGITNGLIPR